MTLMLASFADFLGNLWFAGIALLVGYVGGNMFPLSWLTSKFRK